jgi:hypothetical protein
MRFKKARAESLNLVTLILQQCWAIGVFCISAVYVASRSSEVTLHHHPFFNYRNGSIWVQDLTHRSFCLILVSSADLPNTRSTHHLMNTGALHALNRVFVHANTYIHTYIITKKGLYICNERGRRNEMKAYLNFLESARRQ